MSEAASTEGMGPSASRGHGRFFRKRRGGHLQRERPGQRWAVGLTAAVNCQRSWRQTPLTLPTGGGMQAGPRGGLPLCSLPLIALNR